MAFDIEGARKEGYSDDEIADYLASERKFDAAGARKEGYTSSEIIAHLATPTARQELPGGVTPSSAGAGRGSVNPAPVAPSGALAMASRSDLSGVLGDIRSSTSARDDRLGLGPGAGRGVVNPPTVNDTREMSAAQLGKDLQGGVEQVKGLATGAAAFGAAASWRQWDDALKDMDSIDATGAPTPKGALKLGDTGLHPYTESYLISDKDQRTAIRARIEQGLVRDETFIKDASDAIQRYNQEQQKLSGKMPDFTDVRSVKDFMTWAVRNGIATSPTMAASMVGALAGPLGLAATSGAMAVGDMTSARVNYANETLDPKRFGSADRISDAMANEARAKATQIAKNVGDTGLLAVPYAALDFLGPAGTIARGGVKDLAKGGVKGFIKNTARETGEEMVNEGGQEVVNIGSDIAAGERSSTLTVEDAKRVGNAAAVGGVMGAGGNVVNTAASGVKQALQPIRIEDMPTTIVPAEIVAEAASTKAAARAADEASQQLVKESQKAAAKPAPKPAAPAAPDAVGIAAVPQGSLADQAAATMAPQREEGETDKAFAKRVIDKRPAPAQLPEQHDAYFDMSKGAQVVPISSLTSTKTAEQNQQGGDNGAKRMAAAAQGELSKRAPITVMPSATEPGKYDVVDGNGTLTSVSKFGWQSMPVNVVSREQGQAIIEEDKRLDKIKAKAETARGAGGDVEAIKDAVEFLKENRSPPEKERDKKMVAQLRHFIEPLLKKAADTKADFDSKIQALAAQLGGEAKIPGLKQLKRASEKLYDDLVDKKVALEPNSDMLDDLLRASVVVKNDADVDGAIKAIEGQFEVLRIKDRFTEPMKGTNYRDVLIRVRMPNGLISEIQVHTPFTFGTKDLGHELYNASRNVPEGDQVQKDAEDIQRRLYTPPQVGNPALYRADEALATASNQDKPSALTSASDSEASSTTTLNERAASGGARPMSRDIGTGSPDSTSTTSREGSTTSGRSRTSTSAEPSGADSQSNTAASKGSSDSGIVAQKTPDGVARVQQVADTVAAAWKAAPEIVVLTDLQDPKAPPGLADADARQAEQGAKGVPLGVYHKGKVYLIAAGLKGMSDGEIVRTVFHEALGHAGLRATFGTRLTEILNTVALLHRARVQAKATEYGLDFGKLAERQQAAEEVLAELAETNPKLSIVQRAVAAIRSWLRENFPGMKGLEFSEQELIRSFIIPARQTIERGGKTDSSSSEPALRRSKRRDVGGYSVQDEEDGGTTVFGDQAEVRALMPDDVRGRLVEGGVYFTQTQAPRVLAALSGEEVQYGRAGEVRQNPRYAGGDRKGQYIGAPEKYNTPAKLPQLKRLFMQLALEGEPGKMWYERSGEAILAMVGHDRDEARKFISLLAIYSPQAKVDANSTFALRAWAQYKAGEPIKVKTGKQDSDATAVLYEGKQWGGEKTNNFFRNLMREVDAELGHKDKQGVTVDMWMMRAAGYDTDSPTQAAYRFVENETNRIAQELGWEPQQVQAAIWVAMKARTENAGVKERTEKRSTELGYMRYVPGKKGALVRDVLDEAKHRQVWLDEAFKLQVQQQDTNGAKFDFSDGVRRHMGQVSWEARPGRSTGLLPGIHDAPYQQQAEFQQAVAQALTGVNGEDLLAKELGLLADGRVMAPGVWQSEVAAGMQSFMSMAPTGGKDAAGEVRKGLDKFKVDGAQAALLNTYADVLGLLLRQEGVGWHRPFYAANKGDFNGLDLDIGRVLTPMEMRAVWAAVDAQMKGAGLAQWEQSAALIATERGLRAVSFGVVDNATFRKLVEAAAQTAFADLESLTVRGFASDGDLRTNDWKESPNGEDYRRRISASGRPDVLGWADRVLAPAVQAVFADFSQRYGWGNPGQLQAADSGSAAAAGEVASAESADSAQLPDPFADGYKALDGRRISYEVRVAETGEVATLTLDAGQYLRELDDRADVMRKLIGCLAK